MTNQMELRFTSRSENESLARLSISAFIMPIDPTMDELNEIKTVVSEAVTNAIIHGYNNATSEMVTVRAKIEKNKVTIEIEDYGIGIADLDMARQPLFTTKPELERSGMGFTIMENFMDEITITTGVNRGTKITMVKHLLQKPITSL